METIRAATRSLFGVKSTKGSLLLSFGSVRHYAKKPKLPISAQDLDKVPVHKYKKTRTNGCRLYTWGFAETGALGIKNDLKKHAAKHTEFVQHPSRSHFAETVELLDIATGYGFSLFVVKAIDNFSLFGSGINTDSQLGYHKMTGPHRNHLDLLITPAPIDLPVAVKNEEIQIKKCAAGRAHTVALSTTGTIFTLGNNAYGQCARDICPDEEYAGRMQAHRMESVGNGERVHDIFCGQDHSIFLTSSGSLFACGWGADGQTGLGHFDQTGKPTLVAGDVLHEKIVKVACKGDCVLALSDKGEVFGWGNGEYGQFKCVSDEQQMNTPRHLVATKKCGKIVDIASGGSSCMLLNDAGDVFVWGFGLLGLGPNVDQINEPIQIPATLFGRNDFSPNSRVMSIECGLHHMAAVNDNGDLFMWGKNRFGCLGLGHKQDQLFPFKVSVSAKVKKISCGVDHTLALCESFVEFKPPRHDTKN